MNIRYLPKLIAVWTAIISLSVSFLSTIYAQNRRYDWGLGVHPSIYSYSAVRNQKITNPYEYNRGISVSLSRYINHSFDFSLKVGRSTNIRYPFGDYIERGNLRTWDYEARWMYDPAFWVKYKFDNSYILPEHFVVSPYIQVGFGGNLVENNNNIDYVVPFGFGLSAEMGARMDFVYQSTFQYGVNNPKDYTTHSIGFVFNFGKASRQRVVASDKRERERRAEVVARYRKRRANAREREANERLAKSSKPIKPSPEPPQPVVTAAANTAIATTQESDNPTAAAIDNKLPAASLDVPPNMIPARTIASPAADAEPARPDAELEPAEPDQQFATPQNDGTANTSHIISAQPLENKKPDSTRIAAEEEEASATQETNPPAPLLIPIDENYCVNSGKILTALSKSIDFQENEAQMTAADLETLILKMATVMNKCHTYSYMVVAHTGQPADPTRHRKNIAEQRANTLVRRLVRGENIDPTRLLVAVAADYSLADFQAKHPVLEVRIHQAGKN